MERSSKETKTMEKKVREMVLRSVKTSGNYAFDSMISSLENVLDDVKKHKRWFNKEMNEKKYEEAAMDLEQAHARVCEITFNNKFPASAYRQVYSLKD